MAEEEKNPQEEEVEDIPFKEMKLASKILVIVSIALLIVITVGIVFGIYFFGLAGAMRVLGVEYDSTGSLVLFVIAIFVVGILVELIGIVVYIALTLKVEEKAKRFTIRLIVETICGWFVLFTVDELMTSITISLTTEFILALLMALLEAAFDKEYAEKP